LDPPTIEPQNLAKSCNEALILACLERGPRHGYQIALDIEARGGGTFRFNHGTLYPILHKLEQEGLIKGTWSHEASSRRRKSYQPTAKGRRYAREQRDAWHVFIEHFLRAVEVDES
jgi:DNA-binding PadR family transcriptional regulator